MQKKLLWLLLAKKARTLISTSDAAVNNKCSLPTLIASCAHPGTQEQKVAVLALLTSDTKHAWFEMSNDEASASTLKVFYESPDHWCSIAMMGQAMRPVTRARDPIALELKKSLRKHRKTINELPKMGHVAHFPTLVQTNPHAWTKNSTCALASARTSMQACLLEFTATQEECAVSTTSASVAF